MDVQLSSQFPYTNPLPFPFSADKESSKIHILDAKAEAGSQTIHTFDKLHRTPVVAIRYNTAMDVVVSVDESGILEYWQGPGQEYKFPSRIVDFESKLDTSLFEFAKNKTIVTGIAFSRDGRKFATLSTDRKVRIFLFLSGKMIKMIDETLPRFAELQQKSQTLPNMEFGRRMATEKELEKSEMFRNGNIVFDFSGHFIMYSTMLGIKVVNIDTNKCVNMIGKSDNLRPVHLALYQGKPKRSTAATTIEQEASENPALLNVQTDPTVFCTAFKKQRFYMYSKRLPSDLQDNDRDVFNEKPSKEDIISVSTNQGRRLFLFGNEHLLLSRLWNLMLTRFSISILSALGIVLGDGGDECMSSVLIDHFINPRF